MKIIIRNILLCCLLPSVQGFEVWPDVWHDVTSLVGGKTDIVLRFPGTVVCGVLELVAS